MPDETLGNWHDAASLRLAWADLPGGTLGDDLVAASLDACVKHLRAQGLDVPENGDVPASHRLAQVYFARSLGATRVTNEEAQVTGIAGYEVPSYNFSAKARKILGYGSMGIG